MKCEQKVLLLDGVELLSVPVETSVLPAVDPEVLLDRSEVSSSEALAWGETNRVLALEVLASILSSPPKVLHRLRRKRQSKGSLVQTVRVPVRGNVGDACPDCVERSVGRSGSTISWIGVHGLSIVSHVGEVVIAHGKVDLVNKVGEEVRRLLREITNFSTTTDLCDVLDAIEPFRLSRSSLSIDVAQIETPHGEHACHGGQWLVLLVLHASGAVEGDVHAARDEELEGKQAVATMHLGLQELVRVLRSSDLQLDVLDDELVLSLGSDHPLVALFGVSTDDEVTVGVGRVTDDGPRVLKVDAHTGALLVDVGEVEMSREEREPAEVETEDLGGVDGDEEGVVRWDGRGAIDVGGIVNSSRIARGIVDGTSSRLVSRKECFSRAFRRWVEMHETRRSLDVAIVQQDGLSDVRLVVRVFWVVSIPEDLDAVDEVPDVGESPADVGTRVAQGDGEKATTHALELDPADFKVYVGSLSERCLVARGVYLEGGIDVVGELFDEVSSREGCPTHFNGGFSMMPFWDGRMMRWISVRRNSVTRTPFIADTLVVELLKGL